MRWIFNQINIKQTFIKYLPCARLWTICTKTTKRRHGPCPHGAHSLLKLTNNHKYNSKAPGRHNGEGTVPPGECRASFTETRQWSCAWMRRSSPDGGGGGAHSKQRKQQRASRVLEAHAMVQDEEQSSAARA